MSSFLEEFRRFGTHRFTFGRDQNPFVLLLRHPVGSRQGPL